MLILCHILGITNSLVVCHRNSFSVTTKGTLEPVKGSKAVKMTVDGPVINFVCGRAVEHYVAMALMKRSPKMTANWAFAMVHARGGIFHSFSDRFKIR